MGDIIRSIIGYAITIALIVGVFKFYKMQSKAYIDPNDQSMKAEEYPYGSYRLNTRPLSLADYQLGDVVAFYLPIKPEEHRVGRVVALEGQRIEVAGKTVKVDGKPTAFKIEKNDWGFPEIRVPRGCVFVLSDRSAFWANGDPGIGDSMKTGPLPFYNLLGKLN